MNLSGGLASAATHRRLAPSRGATERLFPPGLGDGPEDLATHLARCGPLPRLDDSTARAAFGAEIEQSGLLGRGGASFPSARKIAAVRAEGRRAILVANGTEGEPASSKDKVLLARAPHLVLDGAVLAAELVGAAEAVLVVHHAVRELLDDAVAARRAAGFDAVPLRVVTAVDRFVAGEASAVVHFLERGVALPRYSTHRLSERGLHGRPTLVQNVETLAHLALIARHGAAWYRSVGTPDEPGTTLVTLLGALERPGVYEVALGAPLAQVLERAGGASRPLQALLVGGYFGTWVPAKEALATTFDSAALRALGAGVGAGMIAALPEDACGLGETARVVRFLADQSAGQCGPCVFGLPSLATQLESLANGGAVDPDRLSETMAAIDGRGACGHPDGAVRLAASALRVFESDAAVHAKGWCSATGTDGWFLPVPSRLT